jgi:hypothetical protein
VKEIRGWKGIAKQTCRDIVARTTDGVPLHGDDEKFVIEILSRHPNARIKIGCGIDYISVQTVEPYHSRGFVVVRMDGSSTDFSYYEAITPSSHVQKVRVALRTIVSQQIIEFRDSCNPLECEINPDHRGPFHVDHADPPFIEIADRFAAYKGGYGNIKLSPHQDGDIGDFLDDQDDVEFWANGHQVIARLRILCQPCNLRSRLCQWYNMAKLQFTYVIVLMMSRQKQ